MRSSLGRCGGRPRRHVLPASHSGRVSSMGGGGRWAVARVVDYAHAVLRHASRARARRAPRLLIGLDAGKVTTSLAWGSVGADGVLSVEGSSAARHHGEPLAPFFALYRALGAARVAGVVAAGAFGDRLTAPALGGIPEEIAQEWAARALYGAEGALTWCASAAAATRCSRATVRAHRLRAQRALLGGHRRDRRGAMWPARCGLEQAIALAAAPIAASPSPRAAPSLPRANSPTSLIKAKTTAVRFADCSRAWRATCTRSTIRTKVDGPVVLIGHGALIGPLVARLERARRRAPSRSRRRPACSRRSARCSCAAFALLQRWARGGPAAPEDLVGRAPLRVRVLARPDCRPRPNGPGSRSCNSAQMRAGRLRRASDVTGAGAPRTRPPAAVVLGLDLGLDGLKGSPGRGRCPARCWPTCTGAPTATRSKRPSAWWPTCARRGRTTRGRPSA